MENVMEIGGLGKLVLEINTQQVPGEKKYWTSCTARTQSGFVVWTEPVTTQDGELKLYDDASEALADGKRYFTPSPDELKHYNISIQEMASNRYFVAPRELQLF